MKRIVCGAWVWASILIVALPCELYAHEGHEDAESVATSSAPATASTTMLQRPHLLADGQLYVPKAVQRQLALRTVMVGAATDAAQQAEWVGEVVADPNAAGKVTATQPGVLEAASGGWPLPGQRVAAGAVLAYLRPLLSQRDRAQRAAALAQIDQDLQISEINVARLKLQAEANGTATNGGNVYYEQAQLEWEGQKEKYRLESEALNSRVAIRAPVAGELSMPALQAGAVVAEGQPLFNVIDTQHLRIALRSFDPAFGMKLKSAQLLRNGAASLPLRLQAQEPVSGQQGWQFFFTVASASASASASVAASASASTSASASASTLEASPATDLHARARSLPNLTPGELVHVAVTLAASDPVQVLRAACVAGGGTEASAWVHVAPERFERRHLRSCTSDAGSQGVLLAAGERVVTQGAALLSEYR